MAFILSSSPYDTYITSPTIVSSDIYVTVEKLPVKTETVEIVSLPSTNYYLPTNLYYSDQLFYPQPMYNNVSYLDVNADKDLQKKVTGKFFSRLYNKWVPELYARLLDYVKLSDKDISLVKSVGEVKNNKTKEDEFEEKINYLADYIMTKKDVFNELYYYSEQKNINWWNLNSYADDIELYLIKKLEQRLKDMILE
jgi:hypothetical protein